MDFFTNPLNFFIMGNIVQGILGGFIGKVGTVVGSVRDGKAYMRSVGYRNTKTATEGQLNQRRKFGVLKRLISPLTPAFAIGFRNLCSGSKPQNVAFGLLYSSGVVGDAPDFEVDYSKLVVSDGNLISFNNLQVNSVSRTIKAVWSDNSDVDGLDPDDQVYMVVLLPEVDLVYIIGGDVVRSSGSISYTVHEMLPAQKAHVYLFMAAVSSTKVSKSFHFEVNL